MNFLKRIKRTWKLANKDEKSLEEFMKLKDSEIMALPNEDTKAVFIGSGTGEEFKEFENEKKFGVKKVFDI